MLLEFPILFAFVLGINLLQFEGLRGTLWDLSTYIQSAYRYSVFGTADLTITDQVAKTTDWHWSIAVPVLGALYRVFPEVCSLFSLFRLETPGDLAGEGSSSGRSSE
ncbi:MAG: hypothetical protein A2583_00625 [Bdellovibrionales bacterium RIFOXYD1_FULL_53_11]|nr:MAG: hypothetical protein A2583_00625 [Bdellovibrionales bacterium RIFOXYD1_FULL_53_11]